MSANEIELLVQSMELRVTTQFFSFQSLFIEVNDLIATGKMNVDGQEVKTEFYLGGNYKFILKMLRLKGATSNYACVWCKIHKTVKYPT